MTDIFGCCCSVDVQHIQTTWWDPVQVYSYSDWEKYPYFSLPLPWVNSHSSYFFKTLKIRRWGGGSWSRRQRYPQQTEGKAVSSFLKHLLSLPWQCQVRCQCKTPVKSCWWAGGSWHWICQREGVDVAQSNSTASVRVKELLQCVLPDCRQTRQSIFREDGQVFMATHCITSAHRLSLQTQQRCPQWQCNDLPIKAVQAEVSRRSHLYSSLWSNFIHFPPLLL